MPDLAIPGLPDDIVTPLTASVLRQAGPSAFDRLLVSGPTPKAAHDLLDGVTPGQLFVPPIQDPQAALAALAGLWLWCDSLEESHRIAQDIVTSTGSYWHAILHRREGDFSNAKYWYRRCDSHPVLKMMGAVSSSIAGEMASDRQVAHALGKAWNPIGFVDLVAAVGDKPDDPRYVLAVRLARAEWEALFTYCVRQAIEVNHNEMDEWDRRVTDPAGS